MNIKNYAIAGFIIITLPAFLNAGIAAQKNEIEKKQNDSYSEDMEYSVRGRIVDTDSGTALSGAQITLVELSRITTADTRGEFIFKNVPKGVFTLGVHLKGFSSYHGRISVPLRKKLIIPLAIAEFEEEITVTALPFSSRQLEIAPQVDMVDGDEIAKDATASIGDALKKVPGISNIPTGNGLGTPVIRGMTGNRIRILNDGFPLNHQQFSWRHSPNIEASLADRIEVVRGPATVLYGPDAMSGVINVLDPPLMVSENGKFKLHGEVSGSYGSNADEFSGRAKFEGALGSISWNAGIVHRDSGFINTPDGELENTDFIQTNGNIALGISGKWGTAKVKWNHWELDTGFYRPVYFRLTLDDDLFSAKMFFPLTFGDIEVNMGHHTNIRKAFPAALQGQPAVDLKLITRVIHAGYHHEIFEGWRGKFAFEWTGIDNTPSAMQKLLPEYEKNGFAVMLFEELRFLKSETEDFEKLILSFGVRWDYSDLTVPVDLSRNLPAGFENDYQAFTGSLGVVYRLFKNLSLSVNVGRGWRPPNSFELFANGVHNGVSAIQIGNPALEEESNLNSEVSLRFSDSSLRGYITLYNSNFDNYIYLSDTGGTQNSLPVYEYRQSDAVVKGIEALVESSLAIWFNVSAGYSIIDTQNEELDRPLPQEPAARLLLSVELSCKQIGPLHDPFISLDAEFVDAQSISGPDEPFGIATDSYNLFSLHSGFDIPMQGLSLGIDLNVRNLFDITYTDFLYSYKAFAPNPGRDIRLTGSIRF